MGWEKVARWSTKAAISLKHVKIEERLLWRAYRKSPTLFRTVHPPALRHTLPQDWGSQPQPKTTIAFISGTAKTVDCKFGRYIHRIHPNKNPWKICENKECGRIQGPLNILSTPTMSGMGTATNFKFYRYTHRVHPNIRQILRKNEHRRI